MGVSLEQFRGLSHFFQASTTSQVDNVEQQFDEFTHLVLINCDFLISSLLST